MTKISGFFFFHLRALILFGVSTIDGVRGFDISFSGSLSSVIIRYSLVISITMFQRRFS